MEIQTFVLLQHHWGQTKCIAASQDREKIRQLAWKLTEKSTDYISYTIDILYEDPLIPFNGNTFDMEQWMFTFRVYRNHSENKWTISEKPTGISMMLIWRHLEDYRLSCLNANKNSGSFSMTVFAKTVEEATEKVKNYMSTDSFDKMFQTWMSANHAVLFGKEDDNK